MLYATTRSRHDVVTAYKTLHSDCFGDGGLYVPFRMPKLNIASADTASQGQTIADTLCALFSCTLTGWDVEALLGRRPIRTASLGRQLTVAELWHNPREDDLYPVQLLARRMGGEEATVSNWMAIAGRIALLFATFASADLLHGKTKIDIAVPTWDFSMPMAAWYAREMGLPIGNIICGCNANGGVWELINHGDLDTATALQPTCTPLADVALPRDLERLIHATLGEAQARKFREKSNRRLHYFLDEEQLPLVSRGIFAAVASDRRVSNLIPAVYSTQGYIMSPYTALAYGAVLDYRATTAVTRPALLIAQRSPLKDALVVERLLKLKDHELRNKIWR